MEKDLPIRAVAAQTGLSSHVIRIWEKRYRAVTPGRSDTNRRRYTKEDVERLQLLGSLTQKGRRIGDIARLPLEELKKMAPVAGAPKKDESFLESSPASLVQSLLGAADFFDPAAFELALAKASVSLSPKHVLEQVLVPFLQELEARKRQEKLRTVHERFVFGVLKPYLLSLSKGLDGGSPLPSLVCAAPLRQSEDLGGLTVLASAAAAGWRPVYLGSNLPAEEIAYASHKLKAGAVVLSVSGGQDALLFDEFKALKALLSTSTALIAAGTETGAYRAALKRIGAQIAQEFIELKEALRNLKP